MLLHEHKDFKDLIATVSDNMGIDPTLVEKDYWIMHCLWGLQQQGFTFELKAELHYPRGLGSFIAFPKILISALSRQQAWMLRLAKIKIKKRI